MITFKARIIRKIDNPRDIVHNCIWILEESNANRQFDSLNEAVSFAFANGHNYIRLEIEDA